MSTKYLDSTGLAYFWTKIKNYIDSHGGDAGHVELTQAQYDALTPSQQTDGTVYFITDVNPTPNNIVDFIVEQGTNGIWTYRKWHSGIAECWGRGTATLTHYATVGGFYGYYTDFALPSGLFTSITAHNYISTVGSGFAMPAAGQNSSTTNFRVYALATASGSQSCAFDMVAKGRWK